MIYLSINESSLRFFLFFCFCFCFCFFFAIGLFCKKTFEGALQCISSFFCSLCSYASVMETKTAQVRFESFVPCARMLQ